MSYHGYIERGSRWNTVQKRIRARLSWMFPVRGNTWVRGNERVRNIFFSSLEKPIYLFFMLITKFCEDLANLQLPFQSILQIDILCSCPSNIYYNHIQLYNTNRRVIYSFQKPVRHLLFTTANVSGLRFVSGSGTNKSIRGTWPCPTFLVSMCLTFKRKSL